MRVPRLAAPRCVAALTALLSMAWGAAAGAESASGDDAPLDGPRAAVTSFLDTMQRLQQGRVAGSKGWARVEATMATRGMARSRVRSNARALHRVIRRIGLPKAGVPDGSVIGKATRYTLFPRPTDHDWVWKELEELGVDDWPRGRIVLAAEDGVWRFTRRTVTQAEALASALAPLPPTRLDGPKPSASGAIDAVVGLFEPTFTETPQWRWLWLLVALAGGVLLGRITQVVLRRIAGRLRRKGRPLPAISVGSHAGPANLLLITIGLTVGLSLVHKQPPLALAVWRALGVLYSLVVAWLLYNLVEVVEVGLTRRTARKSASSLDSTLMPVVRKTLRIFLVVVVFFFVAQNFLGLNMAGWMAGLGIVGLALSLAAQDPLKNLLGSVTIFFDQPFSVGDWVIFRDYEGYVEEIGFRSTRIRLWGRAQVTVPNMLFLDGTVTNVERRPLERRIMNIAIPYDTPPAKVDEAVRILREILYDPEIAWPFDVDRQPPHIAFSGFNAASLNITVYYYFQLDGGRRGYWDFFDHCQEVNRRVLERFNEAGIEFAFPTQTLHLAGDPRRSLDVGVRDERAAIADEGSP